MANKGQNPSKGWVKTTSGPQNGAAPWGLKENISPLARWVWYSADGSLDPTTPGYNHDEYLIFRIRIGAG